MAQKHIQHLTIEIRDNVKEGIQTTKASDTFKERLDIQNIVTERNTLKTRKCFKTRTPQAIDNLLEVKENLIQLLNKSQWQPAGLRILSDKEGLDRAYNNKENKYYDGNAKYV